jgi:hypothetical protein
MAEMIQTDYSIADLCLPDIAESISAPYIRAPEPALHEAAK